jgi:hypothetical protein
MMFRKASPAGFAPKYQSFSFTKTRGGTARMKPQRRKLRVITTRSSEINIAYPTVEQNQDNLTTNKKSPGTRVLAETGARLSPVESSLL